METTSRAGSRRREQTRARLLDAAHEVFGEVGMDAASVELICERAGFTRGAFYSNFDSKDELFLALVTHLAEQKLDEVTVRVRDLRPGEVVDPPTLVRQLVGASIDQQMEPQLMSEIRTQALRDARLGAAYLAWQAVLLQRIEDIIAHVVATYGFRLRVSVPELAQLILDINVETCVRAAIEERSAEEATALFNERITRIVVALVDAD